jgi:hypothetical protein
VPPCASLACTTTALRCEPPPQLASHAPQASAKLQWIGHLCVLQTRFAKSSRGHGRPPFRAGTSMRLVLVWKPVSHDREQGLQASKEPITQSTRGAATSILSIMSSATTTAACLMFFGGMSRVTVTAWVAMARGAPRAGANCWPRVGGAEEGAGDRGVGLRDERGAIAAGVPSARSSAWPTACWQTKGERSRRTAAVGAGAGSDAAGASPAAMSDRSDNASEAGLLWTLACAVQRRR